MLTEGDVDARVWVRIREIEQSFRLLKALAAPICRPGRRALDAAGRRASAKASR